MESFKIELSTKPGVSLACNFVPAKGIKSDDAPFLLFLNGIGMPKAAWFPIVNTLRARSSYPAMFLYDRFAQGETTDRDPKDATTEEGTHDSLDVVHDLHQLLLQVSAEKLRSSSGIPPLFVLSNSIGCAHARLYDQEYPGGMVALLMLDSMMANSDFVSFYPDPDASGFDASTLPEGATVEQLRAARAVSVKIFDPVKGMAGKQEGLSRKDLPKLLPYSDKPGLKGDPWVTVVGHGFEKFADDTANPQSMNVTQSLTMKYTNPYWHKYNEGLAKITSPTKSKGPIQAEKAGHFVQKDDPEFVAKETEELLARLGF